MKHWLFIIGCTLTLLRAGAHPMPNTLIDLTVHPHVLDLDVKIPLPDVTTAVFQAADSVTVRQLPVRMVMEQYLARHMKVAGENGLFWPYHLTSLDTLDITTPLLGTFKELHITIKVLAPEDANVRAFIFYYDAIMHQVVTHQAILSIRQDWEQGIYTEGDTSSNTLAVIQVEGSSGKVLPVVVNLGHGSNWSGFMAMLQLGMRHIAEGYDHLLFLLLLLVAAPMTKPAGKPTWDGFGGWRFGFIRLLKIVTAFTIGHSATLVICSLGWLNFYGKWVEIAIALSIMVTAVHVLRPLFFQQETIIAGAFGLIHGMAFSDTLQQLQLDKQQLIWSLLGFNIGIEVVQLVLVTITAPLLFFFCGYQQYTIFRKVVGVLSALISIYWIAARLSGV